MNEIKAKRTRKLNPNFLPALKEHVKQFEAGEVESMIVFVRPW